MDYLIAAILAAISVLAGYFYTKEHEHIRFEHDEEERRDLESHASWMLAITAVFGGLAGVMTTAAWTGRVNYWLFLGFVLGAAVATVIAMFAAGRAVRNAPTCRLMER